MSCGEAFTKYLLDVGMERAPCGNDTQGRLGAAGCSLAGTVSLRCPAPLPWRVHRLYPHPPTPRRAPGA